MTTNRVVTELIIDARGAAAGSADFQRRMEAAQRAVDRMIEREQKLSETTQQTGQALERGATSVAKSAKQWGALAAALDPVVAAEQRAAKAIRDATLIADSGTRLLGKSQEEASAMVAEVTKRQMAYVDAAKVAARSNEGVAKSSGLARHELVNLSRQMQDVATMAAMGASPMQIFASQGAQIGDVFASSSGTLRGFAGQLAGVVTPARLAGAAIVAAAAGAAFAANSWSGSQRELTRSLYGTGLAAGVTARQLNDMAESAGRAARVSTAAARDTLTAFARRGDIDPALLGGAPALSRSLQATLAIDAAEANEMLSAALSRPVEGYKRLTTAVGGYNVIIDESIKKLVEQGRLYEAQQLLLAQIPGRLAPVEQVTNNWARAWGLVTREISNSIEKLGQFTGGPLGQFIALYERYASARDRVDSRTRELGGGAGGYTQAMNEEQARGRIEALEARLRREQENLRRLQTATPGDTYGAANRESDIASTEARIAKARADLTVARSSLEQITSRATRAGSAQDQTASMREWIDLAEKAARAQATRTQQEEAASRAVEAGTQAMRAAAQPTAEQIRLVDDLVNRNNAAVDALRQFDRQPLEARQSDAATKIREQLRATYEGTSAALEGMLTNGLNGLVDGTGRVVAGTDQIIARMKTTVDLTRERGAVEAQTIRAQGQGQAAEERALRATIRLRQQMDPRAGTPAERRADEEREVGNWRLQNAQNLIVAQQERARSTMLATEADRAAMAVMGGSIAQQETQRSYMSMINDARREYIRLTGNANAQVPEAEAAAYRKLAEEMGRVRQQAAEMKAAQDVLFERQMIGLSDVDQQIARNFRQIYGDDGWRAQMGNATADAARFNDQLKLTNDLAKGFASDLLSGLREGKSLFEALTAAATKFTSKLADKGMDNFMNALLSGGNPFAAFSNTGGVGGGMFGNSGLLGLSPTKLSNLFSSSISDGFTSAVHEMSYGGDGGSQGGGFGGFGAQAGQLVGAGMTAFGAYGAGQQGGAIAGGLNGFMAGMATGNPYIAVASAIMGVLGGAFRSNPARDQAAVNWRINKPETDLYISQLKGEVAGSMATSFAQETKKVLQLSNEASMAREGQATWKAMEDALWKFKIDTSLKFLEPFENMLDALESGLGSNSPIAQAHQAVQTLREEMLKFIDDTETAAKTVSADAGSLVAQAQTAAQAFALTLLTGAAEQTTVRQEFDRLNQTAISLQKVLVDLGMSSQAAATAISEGLIFGLAKLKNEAEDSLLNRYYAASGVGYLNDIADAMEQWAKDAADAQLLGIQKGFVDNTNLAEIQKIITGAKLTDEAFDALIKKFPELEGAVTRAASTLTDIIERRLGYLDRYFNATNDSTTLEGQLRAFERNAAREREEEIKAGGEAMAELEMAIAAERLKVIKDFQTQQDRVLEQAQESYLSFVRGIKEYTDGLRAGAQSPLSPAARLAAAQSQYDAQLALAQGGNRDALNGITSYASDLLEAAKAYYASSTAFQTIWGSTINQLEALPTQVSAEQFIVNAINAASTSNITALDAMKLTLTAAVNAGSASAIASSLSSFFSMLDTSVNGVLDFNEFQAGLNAQGLAKNVNLQQIFSELDTNGDLQLQKDELIRVATVGVQGNTNTTAGHAGTTASNTNATTNAVGAGNLISQQIAALQNTATSQLQILNANFSPQQASAIYGPFVIGGASNQYVQMTGGALDYLRKIAFNTWAISNNTFGIKTHGTNVIGTYGSGGPINGPSHANGGVLINAEGGEFMLRRSAANALSPWLTDLNEGRLPAIPLPMAGNDNREVVRELRELRREVTQLREQVAHHTAVDAAGHARTASAAEETSNKVSQSTTEMRQAANRPRTAGRY